MTCRKCQHSAVKKFGRRNNIKRYRCNSCSAVFTDQQPRMGSHYIRQDQAEKALIMMLEGMSVRAISRITGIHRDTILGLMVTAAEKAQRVFDRMVRNVRPRFVQLDELWAMVGCHGKRVTVDSPAGWGDAWTWLALDSESKMILSFHI